MLDFEDLLDFLGARAKTLKSKSSLLYTAAIPRARRAEPQICSTVFVSVVVVVDDDIVVVVDTVTVVVIVVVDETVIVVMVDVVKVGAGVGGAGSQYVQ